MATRLRGGVHVSFWQAGLICALYAGGTLHNAVGKTRVRYHWIKMPDGKRYRVTSTTLASCQRNGLISKRGKLMKRGEGVIHAMDLEEVEGYCAAFAMHDLRANRSGVVTHGYDRVVAMLEGELNE